MFVLPAHPSPADTTAAPPAAGSSEGDSFFEFLDRVRDDRRSETRSERSDTRANEPANDGAKNPDKVSQDMRTDDPRADDPRVAREASAADGKDQTSNNPATGTPATDNPGNAHDVPETHPATGTKPGNVGQVTGQNAVLDRALDRVLDAAGNPSTAIERRGALKSAVLDNIGETGFSGASGAVTADPETGVIEPLTASVKPGVNDGGGIEPLSDTVKPGVIDGGENAKAGQAGVETPELSAAPGDAPPVNSTANTSMPNTENAALVETQPSIALANAPAPVTLPVVGAEATQNSGGAAAIGADAAARRETSRQSAPNSGSPAIPTPPAATADAPLDGEAPEMGAETARSNPDASGVNPKASGNGDKGGDGAKANSAMTAPARPNAQDQTGTTPTAGAQPTDIQAETLKAAANDALSATQNPARNAPDARPAAPTPPTIPSPGAASITNDLRLAASFSTLTETAAGRNAPSTATQQVAFQISRAVSQDNDRFTLDLKPATLGRISVTMEIGHDNRVIAVIQAERPETLELLQRDSRALERALQEAGLKTDSGSLSFSLHGGNKEELAGDDRNTKTGHVSVSMEDQETDEASTSEIYARPIDGAGLDINV